MENPAAQILRHARHRERIELRAVFLDLPDFAFEGFAERLIGVDRKYPVVFASLGCKVLLLRIPGPRAINHARSQFRCDIRSPVDRSAVDDYDFIAAAKA